MQSIRRRMRLNKQANQSGKVYSFTNPGKEIQYETSVSLETGRCFCSCPDWKYRGSKTGTPCKHIRKHLNALVEKSKRGTLVTA